MRNFKKIVCLGTFLLGQSLAGANAGSLINLNPLSNDQTGAVIKQLFRSYISARPGIKVLAGAHDLNNDGVAELVARFEHSSSCKQGYKSCRTVILRHVPQGWRFVLDRFSKTIEIHRIQHQSYASLKTDDVTWYWEGKSYKPMVTGRGSEVKFEKIDSAKSQSLSAAFGVGARKLNKKDPISLSIADLPQSSGRIKILLAKGDGVCGKLNGCPIRIIHRSEDNRWKTILSSSTFGKVQVSETLRNGLPDLTLETKQGYITLGWSGNGFGIVDRAEAVKPRRRR
ncbi:hypothetical protein [Flexibacterium corallicola]|uniref:hypothetical protein n=1 Tax=Flexibacterium corallicola TaxID=3037259 RepID=UPI00286EF4C7|nr:hypothetical protein [Pseudovibrio sp. M1P-2-3]